MSSNLGVPAVRMVGPPGAIGFEDVVNPDRNGPDLSPDQLHALLAESGRGEPREFRVSAEAFSDLMDGGAS